MLLAEVAAELVIMRIVIYIGYIRDIYSDGTIIDTTIYSDVVLVVYLDYIAIIYA